MDAYYYNTKVEILLEEIKFNFSNIVMYGKNIKGRLKVSPFKSVLSHPIHYNNDSLKWVLRIKGV
jgi:hypothetical protein